MSAGRIGSEPPFGGLALEPIEEETAKVEVPTGRAKFQANTRDGRERRSQGERREQIRFQEDRRSGKDRRPRRNWEPGNNR